MLKQLDFMERFEKDYAAGLIDNAVVANELATLLKGYSTEELNVALSQEHFIEGAIELTNALREAGIAVLIATVTWRFVADWVASQLGGEVISGVELEEVSGLFTGKVSGHAHAINKTNGLKAWCAKNKVSMDRCIAVGDSRSDLHIFENVGLSLAINASTEAKKVATYSGEFNNIWELFEVAPLS